ncbi:hypothetical protein FOCC_FOCC011159 [Frankliniella occidentalis]|nr:hypothetical protein FOCC_FOCC011159 [Frankliniella occidentalis]
MEVDELNKACFESQSVDLGCDNYTASPHVDFEREAGNSDANSEHGKPDQIHASKDEEEFIKDLRTCFAEHGLTRMAQIDILKLLREHGHPSLPHYKNIMSTPRSVGNLIETVSNGQLYYAGIEYGLRATVTKEYLAQCKNISVDFFWDGLSPYTSVSNKVWPILCRLSATGFSVESSPFIVSVFNGKHDPQPAEFLKDFVKEAKELQTHGIKIEGVRYEVRIEKIIADFPARCRMKCVCGEGSAAKIQCEKCTIVGKHITGKGTHFGKNEMRRSKPTLRTDLTFRQRLQKEYHTDSHGAPRPDSPLLELDLDLIMDIPIDPMHLLYCAGVVKRWWEFLVVKKKNVKHRVQPKLQKRISEYMEQEIGKYFPSEYARRVRGLLSYKLFKATEWRRFLLYDGILVAKKFVARPAYRMLLLLSCAVRILSSPELIAQGALLSDAHNLLVIFVSLVEEEFGRHFMTMKVHSLLHLARDCEKHGFLERFSAFPFESYLSSMNKAMRAHGRCLQQIVSRVVEGHLLQPKPVELRSHDKNAGAILSCETFVDPHKEGEKYYLRASLPCMSIRADRERDSFFKTVDNDIIKVTAILRDDTQLDEIYVLGNRFVFSEDFFRWPMRSKTIGIEKVWGIESKTRKWRIESIKCKCVLLRIESSSLEWLCLPLVH